MIGKIKKIILKKNKSKIICLTSYSKNFASIIDTRSEDFRPWDRWTVQPIPESVKFTRKLRGLPKGMTMEIPYYSDNNIVESTAGNIFISTNFCFI